MNWHTDCAPGPFPSQPLGNMQHDLANTSLNRWAVIPTFAATYYAPKAQWQALTGQQPKGQRNEFAYYNDDGVLVAFRHENWKGVFCQMEKPGGFAVWYTTFTCLRITKLFNLRMDPMERADIVSDQYDDWRVKNAYLMGWMTFHASSKFLDTFVDYPPSQTPASFTIDQVEKDVEAKIRALAKTPTVQ